jgi:DNA-binding NarL/FixJ family response regulator
MRASKDQNEVVLSIRIPRSLLERVDAAVRVGRRDRTRSALLREVLTLGIEAYEHRPEDPQPTPEEVQAARDARIKEPEWAPRIRDLHARGLTNLQIAEETGWTLSNVRQKLFRLRLRANR